MSGTRRRAAVAAAIQKSEREEVVRQKRGSILDRVGEPAAALTRIVAKNVPETVSSVEVRTLFSSVGGRVTRVAAVLGATGKSTAYEIDFDDEASARAALSLHQRTVDGRRISLSLIRGDAKKPSRGAATLLTEAILKATQSVKKKPAKKSPSLAPKKKNEKSVVLDVGSAFKKKAKKNAPRTAPKATVSLAVKKGRFKKARSA